MTVSSAPTMQKTNSPDAIETNPVLSIMINNATTDDAVFLFRSTAHSPLLALGTGVVGPSEMRQHRQAHTIGFSVLRSKL
jgi:hypothetical protein